MLRLALIVLVLLPLAAPAAHAQPVPAAPPVAPGVPGRLESEEAAKDVRPPQTELQQEQLRHGPALLTSEATVVDVSPRDGTLSIADPSGTFRLHVTEGTKVVQRGRSASGLSALAPGDEVRATWTADGAAQQIVLHEARPEAPTVPSTPGATPDVERIPPNLPNPAVPEPGQQRAPGSTPGNYLPH